MNDKEQQKSPQEANSSIPQERQGWGVENLPYLTGVAYISTRWDLCTGCGACEIACSMFYYGVINRELSRIRIYRYILPVPKSVQTVCSHCLEEERECEKACPMDPPVIHYDEKVHHVVVDRDRCLGSSCVKCRKTCPAQVPRSYPPDHDYSLVCNLFEKYGKRQEVKRGMRGEHQGKCHGAPLSPFQGRDLPRQRSEVNHRRLL